MYWCAPDRISPFQQWPELATVSNGRRSKSAAAVNLQLYGQMITTTTFAAPGAVDKFLECLRVSHGAEQRRSRQEDIATRRHRDHPRRSRWREAISCERAGHSCGVVFVLRKRPSPRRTRHRKHFTGLKVRAPNTSEGQQRDAYIEQSLCYAMHRDAFVGAMDRLHRFLDGVP